MKKAKAHLDTVMPGYTHLQRAQPTTFAHYMMAYANMFKRDVTRLEDCLDVYKRQEYDSNGQLIFRDNLTPMIVGREVLILISTVNSGKSARRTLECVQYYGGKVQGIAAIFSMLEQVDGIPVYSLFSLSLIHI